MANRMAVKVSCLPSGLVKLSDGLGSRKSLKDAASCPSHDSELVNRSKLQDKRLAVDFPIASDCPPVPVLKVGHGLLGRKQSMSRKTCFNLREIMCAIELEYGIENCWFLTLTLPSDNPDSYQALARWSSFAVNRFSQWLRDNYSHINFARAGVWEYQKRGAPHYHMLLGSDCMDAINIDKFRYDFAVAWMNTLEDIEFRTTAPMFESEGRGRDKERLLDYKDLGKRFCNVQVVEKSVTAYLSKYLSESNHDSGKDKNGLRKSLFPFGTWAQWNRTARALCDKYTVEFSEAIWADNFDDWNDLKNIVFASIERAEDTDRIKRQNAFWTSEMIISKEKGTALLDIVKSGITMLKESGICARIFDVCKYKKKATSGNRFDAELSFHDIKLLSFERATLQKDDIILMANKLADNMNELLLNMLLCEREIEEHLAFDLSLSNVVQMRII